MARIRTVKPEFFRHELLQNLEITHSGKYPMLVFAGLWGHCDKAGRFEWRPRMLKLDILPFMPFEMTETLAILEQAGLVKKYTVNGVEYGEIPTFTDHQRIGGKEAQEPEKHPGPNGEVPGKQRGSTGEATGKQRGLQEGKGREGKGVEQRATRLTPGWTPSTDLRGWAEKERPDLDIATVVEKFRDYWQAKPGRAGTKLDWDATFRNWVREEKPGRRGARPNETGERI